MCIDIGIGLSTYLDTDTGIVLDADSGFDMSHGQNSFKGDSIGIIKVLTEKLLAYIQGALTMAHMCTHASPTHAGLEHLFLSLKHLLLSSDVGDSIPAAVRQHSKRLHATA